MEKARLRLSTVTSHLSACSRHHLDKSNVSYTTRNAGPKLSLHKALKSTGINGVEIEAPPSGCELYYQTLLTPDAVTFIAKIHRTFDAQISEILRRRRQRKLELEATGSLPEFLQKPSNITDRNWRVAELPKRLRCRHVDLGDVSPADDEHFFGALRTKAQGIQTDFDDGNCPTWRNQLRGLYNIYLAVHGQVRGAPTLKEMPILMLRPRAWNMVEPNFMVDGKPIAGPLFDFALLMFHNATLLTEAGCGPFFYLSKLEGHFEARMWNDIFIWTQSQLGIPVGTVKACVLIENILATFEMEEILFELREHSAGLNCGVWDYSASICNKFNYRSDMVLPDRKHLHMGQHFLRSYMDLLVQTCHKRGALATGGMAAQILPPPGSPNRDSIISNVKRAKRNEIKAGVDGFIVYDFGLVRPAQEVFKQLTSFENQIHTMLRPEVNVSASDLLQIPKETVTHDGVKHNVGVAILFIYNWLNGVGNFTWRGIVEDSATAEISRSQVWMWIRNQARFSDGDRQIVTREKIQGMIGEFLISCQMGNEYPVVTEQERQRLTHAADIFEEIVTKRDFPDFITTYLSEEHTFLESQAQSKL